MIYRFKNNGYNLILDVESGTIHQVDDIVYDMIPMVEPLVDAGIKDADTIYAAVLNLANLQFPEEQIIEAIDEVLSLEKQGMFFKEEEKPVEEENDDIYSLCLNITHDCNLNCEYCFATKGNYNGQKGLMSAEVGMAAVDFLVEKSGNRENLEISFFGGEPLMNYSVLKQIVWYARGIEKKHGKKFSFSITTNGVLINDDVLAFLNSQFENVIISLDGRKAVHDRVRPYKNGKGSFDEVFPIAQKIAESRGQTSYYVRGTFTHYNLNFSKDVFYLADCGFKKISMEPVAADTSEEYAITVEDIPRINEQYDIIAREIIKRRNTEREFEFFHFNIDLTHDMYNPYPGCGAGTNYVAITPFGEIFPCHQFVGENKYLLGNVFTGQINEGLTDEFKNINIYTKEKCKKCFARYYCGGGCAANNYHFGNGINQTYDIYCELVKKRLECAIMLKASESDEA